MGRQIARKSKLTLPFVRAYSGTNYTVYQGFIEACKHMFYIHHVTYQKDINKVLDSIRAWKKNSFFHLVLL